MSAIMEAVGKLDKADVEALVRVFERSDRTDAVIRGCEHALRMATLLQSRGLWDSSWDEEETILRKNLQEAEQVRVGLKRVLGENHE